MTTAIPAGEALPSSVRSNAAEAKRIGRVAVCENAVIARAVITGSPKGIGRATALRLAAVEWDVWATMCDPDRDGPALLRRATGTGVELTIQQLDITDETSVTEAFERAGEVEVLVNKRRSPASARSRRARWTIGA